MPISVRDLIARRLASSPPEHTAFVESYGGGGEWAQLDRPSRGFKCGTDDWGKNEEAAWKTGLDPRYRKTWVWYARGKKEKEEKKISSSPLYTMKILKSLFVTFPWILIVLDDFFPPLSKFKLFLDYSRFSLELRNLWKTFRCLGKFNVQVRSLVYQLYRFREIIFFRNNFHYRTTSFDRWFKRRSFFFLSFFSKNIIYSYYTRIIATSWNKMTQARANLRVIFERRSWIHVSRRERGTASGR